MRSRPASIASAAAALAVLAACVGPVKHPDAVSVRTARVARAAISAPVELSGTVVPSRRAALSAAVPGRLVGVRVRVGDRVSAGDVVAVIDDATYRAQQLQAQGEFSRAQSESGAAGADLAAAQAHLALARLTDERMGRLYSEGAVARQSYDQAHSEYLAAAAAVERSKSSISASAGAATAASGALGVASTALADTIVRAPFDGTVVQKLADPGTIVAPGVPIVEVQDETSLELDVAVPQDIAAAVRIGSTVPVRVDAVGRTLWATVLSSTPAGDVAARSVLVKLRLPFAAGIVPGMYARTELRGLPDRGTVVPLAALVTRGGQTGVFVVSEGKAIFVPVRTGSASASAVRVDGLQESDAIVAVSETARLTDGSAVTAAR